MPSIPSNAKIQIPIDRDTKFGRFIDSIYFSPDDFMAMTDADLEAKIVERVEKFVMDVKTISNTEPIIESQEAPVDTGFIPPFEP